MKIKIITSCSGPVGSFVQGQEPTVADHIGKDLCRAGYAERLDAEAQPVDLFANETGDEAATEPADDRAIEGQAEASGAPKTDEGAKQVSEAGDASKASKKQ
ncbi:MAG: hypothetical protein MRY77_05630 [Rhodobacteraceae bacterium]|nr:hypothetical protein [Paracoccaceae bacterium]